MDKQLIIYYFSGTGNARNVAHWFAGQAVKREISTELVDLSETDRLNIPVPPEGALLGFCSPTHGFNLPPVMLNLLARFPQSRKNKVFIINTRAGMKLHKLFLPGLSGIALYYALFVLLFKGYKIAGIRSVDLPSNWLSLHPGIKKKVVLSINEHCKLVTAKFANQILDGKRNFRALYDIIQDLLISPVSVGYYLAGRFLLAKTFFANRDCNHCNLCIQSCPVKAIKEVNSRPFWTYKCESCMHCMNYCPRRAIQTCHGFVALVFFLVYTFVIASLYRISWISDSKLFQNGLLQFTFETMIIIPLYYTGYRILHYLMRFRVVERMVSYTSFTWYKFWRRYKAPKF